MKTLVFLFFLFSSTVFSQAYKNEWYIGGGLSYPRYMTISNPNISGNSNFGFYGELGYNPNPNFGFRLTSAYARLNSFYYKDNIETDNYVNMESLDLDAVYNLLPCYGVSPFVIVGFGMTFFRSDNPYAKESRPWIKDSYSGYQAKLGLGINFKYWDDFFLETEFDYITASNNKIDGNESVNEVKGLLLSNGDSYMNLKAGISWYFSRGEESNICDDCIGIRDTVIKEKIVLEKVVVEKIIHDTTVVPLFPPIYFEFDRYKEKDLTPQGVMSLEYIGDMLQKYSKIWITISGHTDAIGTEEYNLPLSKERAKTVRDYLVGVKHIDPTRIESEWFGESKPAKPNDTKFNRALNRRVEFISE